MSSQQAANRPPALIFGPHIAALGVLRRLAERGIRCYGVDETSDLIVHSRWYRRPERQLAETSDSEVLAEYLRSLRLPRAVLVPCSDNWTLAVSGLPDELRDRFPASVPDRSVVQQFVDKGRFRALVEGLGVPHPRTLTLREVADLDQLSDRELENAFLKPTDPQLHRRHFRTKGRFVHSRAEARSVIETAQALDVAFVFQEWIPGDMPSTVLIDGFVDRSGQVVGMVARRRLRVAPPMVGNTVSSVTVAPEDVAPALTDVARLMTGAGYRGAFNAEFKEDARDGTFKVIEVNPRPAWYIATIADAGLNLPWAIYRDALGLPVEAPRPYRPGRYALYEFRDAVAVWNDLRRLRRPDGPVLAPWLRGDHTVFWWRDPMPLLRGGAQMLLRRARSLRPTRRPQGPNDVT